MDEKTYYNNMFEALREHFALADAVRYMYLYQEGILSKFMLEWVVFCAHAEQMERAGKSSSDLMGDFIHKWSERI